MELTIQGCRISFQYMRTDKADAETVLLLHGWGCDGSIFNFLKNGIADNASIIAVDFPGFGGSDEPPEPWGVPEYAEQIRLLLKELEVDSVSVVAHSFGGRVAIYLAANCPELISKLVITGGAGIRKPMSPEAQRRQKRFKRYNAVLNAVKRVKPLEAAADKLQATLRNKYGSDDYNKLNENMRKTFVKVISQDLSPLLDRISAPTLLIWGDKDTETPLWMGQQMEEQIPDAGLVVFEGRTHFAFAEEWSRFVLIVKQFFFEGGEA